MSELRQAETEARAAELEAAIKEYLDQPNKYTSSFKVGWLDLPQHRKAYPTAINHLESIGKIKPAGAHPNATSWIYLGPEGEDELEPNQEESPADP